MTMIGAIARDSFRGFMTLDSGTSLDAFAAFVRQQLAARLNPGDIVIMDNLSAHKNARVLENIYPSNAEVYFNPPDSPEFNPIEKTWAKIKDSIRRDRYTHPRSI